MVLYFGDGSSPRRGFTTQTAKTANAANTAIPGTIHNGPNVPADHGSTATSASAGFNTYGGAFCGFGVGSAGGAGSREANTRIIAAYKTQKGNNSAKMTVIAQVSRNFVIIVQPVYSSGTRWMLANRTGDVSDCRRIGATVYRIFAENRAPRPARRRRGAVICPTELILLAARRIE